MKKKSLILLITLIILISTLYLPISYAIEEFSTENNEEMNNMEENLDTNIEEQFFEVDSQEKTAGSTLNMYINLSQIQYDVFKVTLKSTNIELENVNLNETNEEQILVESEDDEFYIIVNKSEMGIDKIILDYIIPEDLTVGSKFNLTAVISEYNESEEENDETDILLEEINIEITIIEEELQDNNQQNQDDSQQNLEENNIQDNAQQNLYEDIQNENLQISSSNIQTQENTLTQTNSFTSTNSEETVTYNGSRNNYLETLSVTDYELNTEFNKANTTYFLNVNNDVTEIEINTSKEDSTSTVCIYGNEDLVVGTNKVLISVTAENGDVRLYRIYVTRAES